MPRVSRDGAFWIALAVLAVAVAVACAALVAWIADEPLLLLLRDPVPAFGGEAYVGALSLIGVLVWSGGAVVAAFCGAVARRLGDATSGLLLTFAVLTAVLALDDLLLLHEQVLPDAGIPERFVVAAYAIAMIGILIGLRRRIHQTEWPVLVLALALFGGMALVDLEDPSFEAGAVFEDVLKLLGIAVWTLYLTRTGWSSVMRGLQGAQVRATPLSQHGKRIESHAVTTARSAGGAEAPPQPPGLGTDHPTV